MSPRRSHFRFIKKLVSFLFIVWVLDFGLGSLLRHLYFRQSSGFLFNTTWAIEKTTASLLIFGDSRAVLGYAPRPFEDSFGLEFYNAGCEGLGIEYHQAVLKVILTRYIPRRIILDLSPNEFGQSHDCSNRLAVLFPYLRDHPELKPILMTGGFFENIKFLSRIYPYNSNILSIIMGNLSFNKKRREDFQGHIPHEGSWNEPLRSLDSMPEGNIRMDAAEALRTFLQLAISKGVTPTVVISPVFQKWAHPPRSMALAASICRELGVSFLDLAQDHDFISRPEYFYDELHLNRKGASVFSAVVAERMAALR
jgi:hypothetical protein